MKLKKVKLPKHWEIEWNLNLENGDELELSIGMKHEMVSDAIYNKKCYAIKKQNMEGCEEKMHAN